MIWTKDELSRLRELELHLIEAGKQIERLKEAVANLDMVVVAALGLVGKELEEYRRYRA